MNFLNIGLPVVLVEAAAEALDRGVATIRRNYEASASKGRLTQAEVETRMALLSPVLDMAALSGCDLVIEAVYENLDLKTSIFRALDGVVAEDAILATNTSFLDLDAIAAATAHPERVLGLHFFSPANVMRLLEVVRCAQTAPGVAAAAMALARRIGKVAVLCGVGPGFIANRMMARRTLQANAVILEGPMPWDVDRVVTEFGFSMGPFAMMDLVGLDVIGWDRENSCGSTVQEILCEAGRWGVKRGAGYYDYDAQRKAASSPITETMIRDFVARTGAARAETTDAAILQRLLYPVVNEGFRLLEEGIALRASDIDVALVTGYGWPVETGGPMYWAESIGFEQVAAALSDLEARYGEAFRPSGLLLQLASDGGPCARPDLPALVRTPPRCAPRRRTSSARNPG